MSSRFCAAAIVIAIANLLSAAATVTPSVRVTSTTVPANVSTAISIVVDGRPFAPTGTITLKEGSTVLGTSSPLAVGGLFNVSALFATSGPHTVVAFYSGDANYLPAQSPPTVVQAVATSITLTGTGAAGLVFGIRQRGSRRRPGYGSWRWLTRHAGSIRVQRRRMPPGGARPRHRHRHKHPRSLCDGVSEQPP